MVRGAAGLTSPRMPNDLKKSQLVMIVTEMIEAIPITSSELCENDDCWSYWYQSLTLLYEASLVPRGPEDDFEDE